MHEAEARRAITSVGLFVPKVGDVWHWEPNLWHASVVVEVVDVTWNGQEFLITSRDEAGDSAVNDLRRWFEAAVMVEPANERHVASR